MTTLQNTEQTLPKKPNEFNLIWIDMEMTGLSPENDRIIEVAIVITDTHLNILTQSPSFAIHQTEERMNAMDNWNKGTHTRSGLIERVKASTMDEAQAEKELIAFLKPWVQAGKSPMCGNTICQDRRFMANYMPKLEAYFHYRNLDVSTLKELCKRWEPAIAKGFDKKSLHTALDDIHESIEELKYYRTHFLRLSNTTNDTNTETSGT